jgi:hypothetical protein
VHRIPRRDYGFDASAEHGIRDMRHIPRHDELHAVARRHRHMRRIDRCLRWQRHPFNQPRRQLGGFRCDVPMLRPSSWPAWTTQNSNVPLMCRGKTFVDALKLNSASSEPTCSL